MVIFQHLDVWIVWQAMFADRGKICCLPTRAVEVLFDLRWHSSFGALYLIVGVINDRGLELDA